MKLSQAINITFVLVAVLISPLVNAEDIRNYGDCDICPGSIHYGADEAKKIMGLEGLKLASRLKGRKTIKIDLDGVLKNGSATDRDAGYELIIGGSQRVIHIRSIIDKSYILIVTDHLNAHQTNRLDNWRPEIYLQSGKAEEINLSDSVSLAWEKMNKSNIYQWVTSGKSEISWPGLFRDKVLEAIRLMAE